MKNTLSNRMGHALGLWAAILVLLMGLWANIEPSVLIMRSTVGFLIFWAIGYLAGFIIHTVLPHEQPTEDTTQEQDGKDAGEAMEGV